MKIELKPGEKINITSVGMDGEVTVTFGGCGSLIRVEADMPDSSGRDGAVSDSVSPE